MLTAATILDTFSEVNFNEEFDVHYPLRWDDDFDTIIPKCDFLLVESAWEGKEKSWGGVFFGPHWDVFENLIRICRTNSVPVVYWGKEDPIDYSRFLKIAKLADIIFTTDIRCVPNYARDTGNGNVHVMPFAASATLHKPDMSFENRLKKIAFAGTFWSGAHPERKKILEIMFDAAKDENMLHIWDRNHETPESDRLDRLFPERHRQYIQGCVSFNKMADVYRRYMAFFNANIVNKSSTMFSRRVFEIMACGTPVITSYSPGISNLLESAPIVVSSKLEIKNAIHNLQYVNIWRHKSTQGIRMIFKGHTYTHRVKDICDKIGIRWKDGYNRINSYREFAFNLKGE